MGLCPYCNQELHLSDFFMDVKEQRKKDGTLQFLYGEFRGERIRPVQDWIMGFAECKMFVCPKCDKILGFSESRH